VNIFQNERAVSIALHFDSRAALQNAVDAANRRQFAFG
jgi:hypothetical protein